MGTNYNPSIKTTGLVFCMDASSKTYGQNAQDITRSHTTSLENGASFNSDNYGSIDFDGTDDFISTNLDASRFSSTNTEFTVEIWMDSDINNSAYGLFNLNNGTGEYIEIRMDGTRYFFGTRYNSIVRTAYGIIPFGGGPWANITCVKAPGIQDIYFNGDIETVGSPDTAQGDDLNFGAGGGVVIGSRGTPSSPTGEHWNGKISVVRVYNQAMSAWEVSQNYQATVGRYS